MKIEPIYAYKKLSKLEEKEFDEWVKMEQAIKNAQAQFMKAALDENINRIVLEYNKKGYIEVRGDFKPDEFMGRKILDIEWINNDRPKD